MKVEGFSNVNALIAFVTANAIPQAKVVEIEWAGGTWYLFYYT
jgi:hypothetical protein